MIHQTPILSSKTLDRLTGARLFLKAENLQWGGSFKLRGAYTAISRLSVGEKERGVVAFSSGNHAQAVALAATLVGTSAVVVMPEDAPSVKIEATKGYGARTVLEGTTSEERRAKAEEIAREEGRAIIHPFDDPHVIAGQSTVGIEVLEQIPDLDVAVAPVGGGGLLAGISIAVKALRNNVQVFGVEPEGSCAMYRSLERNAITPHPEPHTIADGLRPTSPGVLTFEAAKTYSDGVVLVSDQEMIEALRFLLFRMKTLVEPSGAAALAAAMTGKLDIRGKRVAVVLSGGNVEPGMLKGLL